MAFKYINPGYVSLLNYNGASAMQVTDSVRSKTGVGFIQPYNTVGVTLKDFKLGDEFWGKFDFYVQSTNQSADIYLWLPSTNLRSGLYISYPSSSTSTVAISHYYDNSRITLVSGLLDIVGIKFNAVNTITFHAILGNASTAKLEVFVGDNKYVSTGRAMPYTETYAKNAILYSGRNVIFSNIIFSDSEISTKEQTMMLTTGFPTTDMTLGNDGVYVADAAGQTLLQSVYVDRLIDAYGEASAVTGIQVVGNPAFKTGEELATLKSISKAGGVTTEHGTFSLSEDRSALIMDGWRTENLTIAGLSTMEFGWEVGE